MRALLASLSVIALTGCLSQSSLDGFELPREGREPGMTFSVHHQSKDERNLHRMIAESLQKHGLKIVASDAGEPTYVVSYVDRWYWDMRVYLIDLRIDIRDARTNQLVAVGRSYQTSLAAMGESHESIVERTVEVLFERAGERLSEKHN